MDDVVPPGTRILHIGPPKTATTTVQQSFWEARDAIRSQGVRYAGSSRHSAQAVLAVTGRASFAENRATPPIHHWEALLAEIRGAAEPRVVLSSEGFAYANATAIERVVQDLGADRLRVVVTLRPLSRLLVSQWQEHVQSGVRIDLDEWLDAVFNRPESVQAVGFWHRHRHDELIARWAEHVGPDRVTAIVIDPADHAFVLRAFEGLLGLADGTLALPSDVSNRSLTAPEMAAIMALRSEFEAAGLSYRAFHRIVRMRVAAHMKTRKPPLDEPRIAAPQWALDRAGEVAADIVAGIRALGVHVVGDLDSLTLVSNDGRVGEGPAWASVPPEVAAAMAMGALAAGGVVPDRSGQISREDQLSATAVGSIAPADLLYVLRRRAARYARRVLAAAAGRIHARLG